MLQLNGYLHRERLSKILGRSLTAAYEGPDGVLDDSRALKQIVNFNAYCGCLILDAFGRSLLSSLHGQPVQSSVVHSKGALEDVIASDVPKHSPRIQDLIARYQRHPEDYYRETPVNGRIYRQQDRFLGASRVLAQRSDQQYQGSVAKNIEWLMEYLFRFCLSPHSSLDEFPIRLWARYMPDYIDLLHGRLGGTSAEADFTQACLCGRSGAGEHRSAAREDMAATGG